MKTPNFKPTKWKIQRCLDCQRTSVYGCGTETHKTIELNNIPFFVTDMKFKWIGPNWSCLNLDKLGQNFMLSASKLEKIIKGCGIEPGGKIPNQFWMFAKVGSSATIVWVPNE